MEKPGRVRGRKFGYRRFSLPQGAGPCHQTAQGHWSSVLFALADGQTLISGWLDSKPWRWRCSDVWEELSGTRIPGARRAGSGKEGGVCRGNVGTGREDRAAPGEDGAAQPQGRMEQPQPQGRMEQPSPRSWAMFAMKCSSMPPAPIELQLPQSLPCPAAPRETKSAQPPLAMARPARSMSSYSG